MIRRKDAQCNWRNHLKSTIKDNGPIFRGWVGTKGPSWVPLRTVMVSDRVVLPQTKRKWCTAFKWFISHFLSFQILHLSRLLFYSACGIQKEDYKFQPISLSIRICTYRIFTLFLGRLYLSSRVVFYWLSFDELQSCFKMPRAWANHNNQAFFKQTGVNQNQSWFVLRVFPALGTGFMFSCAQRRLRVFPR